MLGMRVILPGETPARQFNTTIHRYAHVSLSIAIFYIQNEMKGELYGRLRGNDGKNPPLAESPQRSGAAKQETLIEA